MILCTFNIDLIKYIDKIYVEYSLVDIRTERINL